MADDGADWYAILGVPAGADGAAIRSAYRRASLAVHPDRNPDDPLAAEKFHALTVAFEGLSDPARRGALDDQLRAARARAERFAALDAKRKNLVDDLAAREAAAKRARADAGAADARERRLADIRAAGVRLRETRQAELDSQLAAARAAAAPRPRSPSPAGESPIVRLRWSRKREPALADRETLTTRIVRTPGVRANDLDSIVLAPVPPGADGVAKKPSAIAVFRSSSAAHAFLTAVATDAAWSAVTATPVGNL